MSARRERDSVHLQVGEESWDRGEVVAFETSLAPIAEAEMAFDPSSAALEGTQEGQGPRPEVSLRPEKIVGSSPASCFGSDAPQAVRCFQVAPQGDTPITPLNDSQAPLQHHDKSEGGANDAHRSNVGLGWGVVLGRGGGFLQHRHVWSAVHSSSHRLCNPLTAFRLLVCFQVVGGGKVNNTIIWLAPPPARRIW